MRLPSLANGNGETLDQNLDRQPVEAGRRRIEDEVADRARYLAAFGTMTLAGGAEFSVDFETDFAAQTGTSKRRCHRGPSFPVCGAFIPAPASARDNARGYRSPD